VTAAYWKARVLAATADPAALEALAVELAALAASRPELDTESTSPVTFAVPPGGAGFAFGPVPGVMKTFDRIATGFEFETDGETVRIIRTEK
jgi:hypothetical protein